MRSVGSAFADVRLSAVHVSVFRWYLIMAAILAAISLVIAQPPLWLVILLVAAVVVSGVVFRLCVRRADAIRISALGQLYVQSGGSWHEATLLRHSFAAPWLLLLRLQTDAGGRCYFCWHAGCADAKAARRLRIVLCWGR